MGFEKHLEREGVALAEDNSLPAGQRTQKVVKRVIHAVRAAEAEFNDELREANVRCRRCQDELIELQRAYADAQNELRQLKLSQRMKDIEKLTASDREALLLEAK